MGLILRDKVVIFTGTGPGLGQAACRSAAAEGAKVAISSRSTEYIETLASEIRASGDDSIAVRCDVSQATECAALTDEVLNKWGRVDGLVNSAYYHPDWHDLETHPIDQLLQAFDVIAAGALRMSQAVIPSMRAHGTGSIVNVSTLATRKPMPGEGGYAMAKAALNQLTRQLAIELGGTGIRVNTALMGWMDGAPLRRYFSTLDDRGASVRDLRTREIPLGRIPTDENCAKTVLFLLSDYASEVNGAAIDVNGGDWVAM